MRKRRAAVRTFEIVPLFQRSPHHQYRLKQRSGHSAGDSDQLARAGEDLDQRGLRELRQIGLRAVAQPAQRLAVAGHGGHLRQQSPRMHAQSLQRRAFPASASSSSSVWASASVNAPARVRRKRLRCAPQPRSLPQFVRHGAHISAGADVDGEAGLRALKSINLEGIDPNAAGFSCTGLPSRASLYAGLSVDLFGGKRRRHLLHLAVESRGGRLYLRERQRRRHFLPSVRCCRLAPSVIGVRREPEANAPRITLPAAEKYCARRVNLPISSGRTPVAMGSSVPGCK